MLLFYLSLIDTEEDCLKFEDIYYKCHETMYNIAYVMTHDDQITKEILSKSFESIARNIETIEVDNPSRLKNYIYKVVKNHCYNHFKSKHAKVLLFSLDDFSALATTDDTIEDAVVGNETYKRIVSSIYSMRETYRDVLSFHYVYEMSDKEIAKLLERPLATVRSQIQRGTKILQKILKKEKIDE